MKLSIALIFILGLFFTLNAEPLRLQCSAFYGLNPGPYLIPHPTGNTHEDIQIQSSEGSLLTGFVHTYLNRSFTQAQHSPVRGSFEYNQRRIEQAPKWFGLFDIASPFPNRMQLSDLQRISNRVRELNEARFIYAPSLSPATYAHTGKATSLEIVKLMADRKFVVSTLDQNLWRHDLFDHGIPGYLLLPKQIADRFVNYAQLLMSLQASSKLQGSLSNRILGEIDRFAGEFDELTQNISKSLRDSDPAYLFSVLNWSFSSHTHHVTLFLSDLRRSRNSLDIVDAENKFQSVAQTLPALNVNLAYFHILNAFTGDWTL